jgi:hypothetical protein
MATFIIWACFAKTHAVASPDAMSFTYKEDKFPGIMDFRFVYATGPFVQGTAERFRNLYKVGGLRKVPLLFSTLTVAASPRH